MQKNKRTPSKQEIAWASEILARLTALYPTPLPQLEFKNPWQLMLATILAAQCTDERVNKVTPELFSRWPGPKELAEADVAEVEQVVRSTGLFRSKAKNMVANAKRLIAHFGGQVPDNMADLVSLPGVARKTANIVLWAGFGKNQGVAVDTHVGRITWRLGLTREIRPEAVEKDLMALFPPDSWGDLNNRLVWFGRDVCPARTPHCPECVLFELCERNGLDADYKPINKP
jgi:endonuclease III